MMAVHTYIDQSSDGFSQSKDLGSAHGSMRHLVVTYGLSSLEYFEKTHDHPFLIQVLGPQVPTEKNGSELLECPVYYVKKRNIETDPSRITVGRVKENDLFLPDSRVSTRHGYFEKNDDDGRWYLVDTGSSNGTFVDGKQLEARSPKKMRNGTEIYFSRRLAFAFVDAKTLYGYIIGLYNQAHG